MHNDTISTKFVIFIAFVTTAVNFYVIGFGWPVFWPLPNQDAYSYPKLPDFSSATISEGFMKIPKILHQTWKNGNKLPRKYAKYHQAWKELHPEWTHHLWTDEENRELVRGHYPWLLAAYDKFPVGVMRSDAARILYLHKYGGVYADLDIDPIKNIDFLLDNTSYPVTAAYMRYQFRDESNVPAAFMISTPGHPLWMVTAFRILALSQHMPLNARPDYVTGPFAFYQAILDYTRVHKDAAKRSRLANRGNAYRVKGSIKRGSNAIYDIRMLEPGLIYPYHWSQGESAIGKVCDGQKDTHNETACKAFFPEAYAIQYSGCSWCKKWSNFLEDNLLDEVG